jgi:hypothetical protein
MAGNNTTEVVVVIKNGMLQSVYSNKKNVIVELLDMDTQRDDEIEYNDERLTEIKRKKSYKEVF